jgi:hypothetical protein
MEKIEKVKNEKKQPVVTYGAMERCKAVLSVWTERRKPAEVCRELSIPWMVLSMWQRRAMEGMLQALEPRVNLDRGPALSPRLQMMLEKNRLALALPSQGRLQSRLVKVQGSKTEKTGEPALKDEKKP